MVHGGGHHHHGGGGSSGWGGASRDRSEHRGGHHHHHHRPCQDNIVVVNNPPSYGSTPRYRQRDAYYYDRRRVEECRGCCGQLCRGACLALGCFTLASAVERHIDWSNTQTVTNINPNIDQAQADFDETDRAVVFGDPPPRCDAFCPWSFVSVFLLVVLLLASGVRETWTLNPGETRRVPTHGFFTREIHVLAQTPGSVNVYNILGDACPPLTGPPVELSGTVNIKLAPDDYQFDYFYLNEGSTADLVVTQTFGATNTMILKGIDSLEESNEDDEEESFTKQAVLIRYAGEGQVAHLEFTAASPDVYVMLYDSASSAKGRATVEYHINLTTYDLHGVDPLSSACSPLECTVTVDDTQCILLQALQSLSTPTTVHITSKRRWPAIALAAILPLLVGLVLRRWATAVKAESAYNSVPPMTPPWTFTATAPSTPMVEPSVPVCDDYESIPIVAGPNVVPVAAPLAPSK